MLSNRVYMGDREEGSDTGVFLFIICLRAVLGFCRTNLLSTFESESRSVGLSKSIKRGSMWNTLLYRWHGE